MELMKISCQLTILSEIYQNMKEQKFVQVLHDGSKSTDWPSWSCRDQLFKQNVASFDFVIIIYFIGTSNHVCAMEIAMLCNVWYFYTILFLGYFFPALTLSNTASQYWHETDELD